MPNKKYMNNPVNVYKMTIQVIDFNHNSEVEDIISEIENSKYYCVNVRDVKKVVVDWTDQHPLNMNDTAEQTFFDLFKE